MHARTEAEEQAAQWPEEIFAILQRHDVRQVPYVPDAGHSQLINRVLDSQTMRGIPLTTEEEGIALLCGAWIGGQKGVLLMQSSGVGNCINMLSLAILHRTPLAMIVTMRGDWGEFNPAQVPMGQATQTGLEAMGTLVRRPAREEDVAPTVDATIRLAFNTYRPTATLIGQRVLGAKTFGKD